jgi:inosose dehydratase
MTTDAWAPTRMPLANAPVSFGFWGPHAGPQGVSGRSVLHAVAAAGYAGSELGPAEHLGDVSETAAAYLDARLQCAGVHLGLHLQDPDGLSRAARLGLADVCRRPVAVQHAARQAGAGQAELPLGPIVLADEGSSILRDHPARAPADRSSALDDATWKHAVQTITEAQQVISEHGLATSFHPHLATHVESAWEVERLLSTTGVGITLDTGHLLLAGADPVACLGS